MNGVSGKDGVNVNPNAKMNQQKRADKITTLKIHILVVEKEIVTALLQCTMEVIVLDHQNKQKDAFLAMVIINYNSNNESIYNLIKYRFLYIINILFFSYII